MNKLAARLIVVIIVLLSFCNVALAQTRNVNISWATSTGITGYAILTSATAAGPFTFRACTGAVPSQTCVTGSTAATSSYTDSQTVGTTVFYEMQAYGAVCTPTTPVGTPCGAAPNGAGPPSAVVATTIPPQPIVTSVVVSIQ